MSPTKLLDVHGADSIAITVINRQPLCRLDLVRRDSVPAIMPPARPWVRVTSRARCRRIRISGPIQTATIAELSLQTVIVPRDLRAMPPE